MTAPRLYLLLGAAVALLYLVVPASAPQPGDHERVGCGSVADPVRPDVSGLEPVYRAPTVEGCAHARSARVVRAATAAGAAGALAATFMYLRRRGRADAR